jgi:adenylosuccinate lyase
MSGRYKHEISALWTRQAILLDWALLESTHLESIGKNDQFDTDKIADVTSGISQFISDLSHGPSDVLIELDEIESVTGHDFESFLLAVEARSKTSTYLHVGLTSSDIIDTALMRRLVASSGVLHREVQRLILVLSEVATTNTGVMRVGMTHGQAASGIAWDTTLLGHKQELERRLICLVQAANSCKLCKFSGPVGSPPSWLSVAECLSSRSLGCVPTSRGMQIICRDDASGLLFSISGLMRAIYRIANNIRLWSISGVEQIRTTRQHGYTGSSSMPHKNNPSEAERVCGISKLVCDKIASVIDAWTGTWMERDISASSVERIELPEIFELAAFCVVAVIDILSKVEFLPATQNINDTYTILTSMVTLGQTDVTKRSDLRAATMQKSGSAANSDRLAKGC